MVPYIAELSVRDLALVSELRLELSPGLTVLTGETGAGKSMLVDALLAGSGSRVASGMVREGAERAYIEAVFSGVRDDDLVLSREIAAGRSPARIDQRTVPVASLAETGADLVAFGGHAARCERATEAHAKLLALRRERQLLGGDPRQRERRVELLGYEVEEIRAAKLRPNEEAELDAALTVADQHVAVHKEVRKGRTHVVAQQLDERETVAELAEMLGAGGAKALAAGAKELRDGASGWRNSAGRSGGAGS